MEKLSVVIPVYNTYQYLRECLDSIINQTYKNLEIIIVNDASPYIEDDEICKEYAQKDSRIIYIKHDENKKQGGARNTGIKVATGKYITFIDSDDYLLESYAYERIMNHTKRNKIDVISFGIYTFIDGKDEERIQIYRNAYYKKAKKINIDYFPSDIVCNKIFKLDILKNNKLEFKERTIYEDTEFWYRYVITINPTIKYIDENYYMYRQRTNSVMSTSINMDKRFEVYRMIYAFIKEYNKEKEYRKNIIKWIVMPENFSQYPNDIKEAYRKNVVEFMRTINLKSEEIFNLLDMQFFIMFITDDYAVKKYTEVIDNYKKIKYKYTQVNVPLYKAKREVKRIFTKIKNLLIK